MWYINVMQRGYDRQQCTEDGGGVEAPGPGQAGGCPSLEEIALVALYCRGLVVAQPPPLARAAQVGDLLAAQLRDVESAPRVASQVLRRRGLNLEASILADAGAWARAHSHLERGWVWSWRHAAYPQRWRRVLRPAAPPALWARGEPPAESGRWLGWAGTRAPRPSAREMAGAVAERVFEAGWGLVSGGARGIDQIPRQVMAGGPSAKSGSPRGRASGRLLSVLPEGLGNGALGSSARLGAPSVGETFLSAAAPAACFSTAQAMARNALIYAAGPATIVFQPRYRTGGTWHGAVAALRQRWGRVWLWAGEAAHADPEESLAISALTALGAEPFGCIEELLSWLATPAEALEWTGPGFWGVPSALGRSA